MPASEHPRPSRRLFAVPAASAAAWPPHQQHRTCLAPPCSALAWIGTQIAKPPSRAQCRVKQLTRSSAARGRSEHQALSWWHRCSAASCLQCSPGAGASAAPVVWRVA